MKPGFQLPKLACTFALLAGVVPLAAQTQQTEQQFIASTTSAVTTIQSSLPPPKTKVVLSGNLVYANGAVVTKAMPLSGLLAYVDGLKAAGAQRVDLNPGVTSINDPAATAVYDALVAHIRELGMQLAINPQVVGGELGSSPTFQSFQSTAIETYPAMAARYQPDNFVVVHEASTMSARLGITPDTSQWDGFIRAVAPLIQAASPRTRLGAGGFYDTTEDTFFRDFVTIPLLDFMTIDIYGTTGFDGLNGWIQLAQSTIDPAHPNGKGIYIEETWAPKFLQNPLPPGWQSNPGGLDAYTLVGSCSADFATLDVTWLQAMLDWAASSGMEAVTAFTTETFFSLGSAGYDKPFDQLYLNNALQALQTGELTSVAQAFQGFKTKSAVPQITSLSSASYATVPSVFNANCGSATDPCYARSVVAPDNLVSAFGTDLATTAQLDGSFPTNLAGTTATLVDSSKTSYAVPLFFVSPGQVNYFVPAKVKSGPATLTVKSADGAVTSGMVLVSNVMPGLYTAGQNGQGVAAAIAIIAHSDKSQTSQVTFTCSAGAGCVPSPISPASTDALYVEFYGTGIRHVSALSAVSVTVNGQSVPVQYAGASGYTGEDQVNIQIPASLFHSGTVNVILTADGQPANTVTLNLQ